MRGDAERAPDQSEASPIEDRWQPIAVAPPDCDLEIGVADWDGVHRLVFPCRRSSNGWVNSETAKPLPQTLRPTHWREWNVRLESLG
jgi:hypothetical protein